MTIHACPICNQTTTTKLYAKANYNKDALGSFAFASRKLPEFMHHEIIQCIDCQFLFCVNIPTQEILSSLYKIAAFDSRNEARNASDTYKKYFAKYQSHRLQKNRAMDIGTGEGSFLGLLLADGWKEIIGVEPSSAPIECADEEIKPYIINDIFIAEDFDENSFDFISLFQTIEHIPDSFKLLSDIRILLTYGEGVLYLVCHNYQSLINRLLDRKSVV